VLSGIYYIENSKNDKRHIGQSINIPIRKSYHFYMLENNKHDNSHLQRAYNRYKANSFKFKVLIYCEPFELTRYEQFFVDYYPRKKLYNIRLECVDSSKGVFHSEETRQKMSKSHSGEKCHNSKLTERQVFEILDLYYNKNVSKTNISKNFPVNRRAIYNICNGVTWKRCYKKFIKNR
jgi:group I intron endonuclease